MRAIPGNWRNVLGTTLLLVPVLVGCNGPWQPRQRHELCRPWPGYEPVPCYPCRQPACQPAIAPPCECAPVEVCEPICVRPAEENDARTGLRLGDQNDEPRAASR